MKIVFKKVDLISPEETINLWKIFQQSSTINLDEFKTKQETLDQYALYFNAQQKLIGYTGIRSYSFKLNTKKYRAIYFGQTIVEKNYRGKKFIQNTVIRLLLKHLMSFNLSNLIIWNDSVSYRPYLVMAKNLKSYYPNMLNTNQEEFRSICNLLGKKYYGAAFCSNTGTIIKPRPTLRKKELVLSKKDLEDPHIKFYVTKNPNYTQGHGLITFCPATLKNLFFYLRKITLSKH